MGELVQGGSSLVLVVAAARQRGQVGVVDVAVGDDVLRGQGVGQDIALAVPVGVGVVVRGGTGASRLRLTRDGLKPRRNHLPGGGGGGLEVFLELGCRA